MPSTLTMPGLGGGNSATAAGADVNAPSNQGGQNVVAAPIMIPFTRAAVQKSKLGPFIGPQQINNAALFNFGPYQIPTGGFFRRLRLSVTGVTAGNAAAVAFLADGPWSALQQIGLTSASGGQIIYNIDGYSLYLWNKYGMLSESPPGTDPKLDPSFSTTTGAGGTGGSFNFNITIPVELDARDGLGALINMAGNQLFQLQGQLGTTAQIYSTAPTTAPIITIVPVYEFWALPDQQNSANVQQAQTPPGIGTALLLQLEAPVITPGVQQKVQLHNVGNLHRNYLFIVRAASGVRDTVVADWPNIVTRYVNGNPFHTKTRQNWIREMQKRHCLNQAGGSVYETAGNLDNGVYAWSEFIKDGDGSEYASAACNRNAWPVTERSSVLEFDFNSWGATASTLSVQTLSVTAPSPQALYQPYVG